MKRHQLPGRQEALRAVLRDGDQCPDVRHLAGLDRTTHRQPPAPMPSTFTFTSGIDELTPAERAALPF